MAGFFVRAQWWWVLVPETLQLPAISAARGACLGLFLAWLRSLVETTDHPAGGVIPGTGGRLPVIRRLPSDAWLGTAVLALLTLLEGTTLEQLAFAAAGGAFIGAAVDRTRTRPVSPARRVPDRDP
jgi:hypothetical protein